MTPVSKDDDLFPGAPDVKKAFDRAREDKPPPSPDQDKPKVEHHRPQLRPSGPMRGMASQVDRRVQMEEQSRRAAERKAGGGLDGEQQGKKPRRVTQLARSFNRAKDKGNEPEP